MLSNLKFSEDGKYEIVCSQYRKNLGYKEYEVIKKGNSIRIQGYCTIVPGQKSKRKLRKFKMKKIDKDLETLKSLKK
jgi:protein tyrosine phosphatase